MGAALLFVMISWRETRAPATSSSSSSGATVFALDGPADLDTGKLGGSSQVTTAVGQTVSWSATTVSHDYTSRSTLSYKYLTTFPVTSPAGSYIVTTSSGVSNSETIEGGETVLTKPSSEFRHVETSTTATATALGTTTATTTAPRPAWSTSSQPSTVVFGITYPSGSGFYSTTQSGSSLTTASTALTNSATVTTTLSSTELDPSYYATVWCANGTNEVIVALGSSSAGIFGGNFAAATALATTGSQITVEPWSRTISLSPVATGITLAPATDGFVGIVATSATATAAALTTEHSVASAVTAAGEVSKVQDSLQLPWLTSTTGSHSAAIYAESLTYKESQSLVTGKISTATRWADRKTTMSDVFADNTPVTGTTLSPRFVTAEVLRADTNTVGTMSKSQDRSGVTWDSSLGTFRTTTGGETKTEVTTGGGIGWAPLPQGIASAIGTTGARRMAREGAASSGSVAAMAYSSPFTASLGADYLALHARAPVSTIMPGTYTFSREDAERTMSFSGLSATASYLSGSVLQTTSFVISPVGEAPVVPAPHAQRVLGGRLGLYESEAATISPGVYRSRAGSAVGTFSTTGQVSTAQGSTQSGTTHLEPISYIIPAGTNADFSPLVWSVQRNSATSP